jgi:hypothetical protein
MEKAIPNIEWQVLRVLARQGRVRGRGLRMVNGRRTKNGEHLTGLQAAGLIRLADLQPDAETKPGEPLPFRQAWELTAEGAGVAERGWYEGQLDDDTGVIVCSPGIVYPADPPPCQ